MSAEGYPVFLVETWRSCERQDWLHAQGRSRPGPIVTNARCNESAHQSGRAADLAFRGEQPFDLAHPWHRIGELAEALDLIWGGSWGDLGHVEMRPRPTYTPRNLMQAEETPASREEPTCFASPSRLSPLS